MSGVGKTTIAQHLEQRLRSGGARVELLDADLVRPHLSRGLGFTKEDRDENVRRVGFICQLLTRNGIISIAATISPYRATRDEVRSCIGNFIEVFVTCPLDVLIRRDPKGLYKRALAGNLAHFTGISDPYEPPLAPNVLIDSSVDPPQEATSKILQVMKTAGLISAEPRCDSSAPTSPSVRHKDTGGCPLLAAPCRRRWWSTGRRC